MLQGKHMTVAGEMRRGQTRYAANLTGPERLRSETAWVVDRCARNRPFPPKR
jgi:hypothetical protein